MLATTTRTTPGLVSIVAMALAFVMALGAIAPAFAETAGQRSTRNIILGAFALTAGIILYNNYHHKQVAHNTIVGHTYDGGTVYADGHIVYPDGTVVYTSNNGRTRCDYLGNGERCGPAAHGYAWRYAGTTQWHGRGHHLGHYKHHGEGDNNDNNDNQGDNGGD
ncbi:MAG: hypothetical protein M3Z37_06615 [Candidatus Eremiobacteraeota bacterium]|nr:hypothetical protein [Candidatus Eremiobacteraeota bacterium]